MKTLKILTILMILSYIVSAQNSTLTSKPNADFEKLTFEVEPIKKNYLQLEPIYLKFRVSNQTKTPLAANRPQFLLDSRLKVTTPSGKIIEITDLTVSDGRSLPLPGSISILQPLQFYESYIEEEIPAIDSNIFAETGTYRLQFTLYGQNKSIESNIIEIVIEAPQDIDKAAFSFLNQYKGNLSFYWVWEEKNGLDTLKDFISKYGQSVYGEYAIQYLGSMYLSKGEIDKAKAEFEKIKNSHNKYIANIANQSLISIERKKTESEKKKKQL